MINDNYDGNKNTSLVAKNTRMDAVIYIHHCTQSIATVSICLTENHMNCLGGYKDFSDTYFIKCGCPCHDRHQADRHSDLQCESK
jgi:hypothetical protein